MAALYNLARVTTSTTGTGTITLGAAVPGFLTFAGSGVPDGTVVSYGISDGINSEVGTGTYTSAGTTLTRTVTKSTNANAAISLSGSAQVFITALAEDVTPKPRFAFEGDSLTDVGGNGTWPLKLPLLSAYFAGGNSYYYGVGADTAAAMVAEYATQGGLTAPSAGQPGYYFLWAGTNDITLNSTAAATIYNDLKTMWAAARASGYKVVAFTIMPRGVNSPTQAAIAVTLNGLILSDTTLYDFVARPDVLFPNFNDATYSLDTQHLNPNGNAILAKYIIRLVLGLDNSFAAPFDAGAYNGLQVNGSCDVDQDRVGAAITATNNVIAYPVDGWLYYQNGTMAVSIQQVADAPVGLSKSIKISVTTAEASIAAGDYAFLYVPIEGYRISRLGFGTSAAQPLSIGFWTKHHRTGLYGGSVRNGITNNRACVFSYTQNVADTWEFKTVTIPGDVTGTWATANTAALSVNFALACGSTYLSAAGAWAATSGNISVTSSVNGAGATSDIFQVSGLIVLPGIELPSSARAPFIMRPFDQELTLCQRYYEKSYDYATAKGAITLSGAFNTQYQLSSAITAFAEWTIYFKTRKRLDPTMTFYSPNSGTVGKFYDGIADSDATADTSGEMSCPWYGSVTTSTTIPRWRVHWIADARL